MVRNASIRLRLIALATAVVAILWSILLVQPAQAQGGRPLQTTLTGAEEAPGPGDPDGSGVARLTVNPGLGEICYEIVVTDIAAATGAHIHVGPAGVAGPVVVALAPPDASGASSGCVGVQPELARAIIQNPEQYYVNVHTFVYPAGALRGQLGD